MRLPVRAATAALIALTTAFSAGTAWSADTPEPTPAPLHTAVDAVPGQYIVTLETGVDAARAAHKLGLKPSFVYTSALHGFAAPMTALQLTAARITPGVKSVEEDARVQAVPMPASPAGGRAPASSWGLDRIDQKLLPLDGEFTTHGSGAGVSAYILDSGIDYGHPEFGGRAVPGFDAIGDGRNGQDCRGHGTHVAGTVGGATHGVARKASLVSVRVLGCDGAGSWSGIIAGMDWVAKNARQPAVLNASLGGERSQALNSAATALSGAGVVTIVAAGNSAADACNISPASAQRVTTVGATDRYDQETAFSNHGPCLSLYAPGQAIVSAKLGGGSTAQNGTSMAAPHVTGVAALYRASHPEAGPAAVREWLESRSTKDVVTNLSTGSPNRLLFTADL
ncbi:S8 family serine peptidase [Streptomyces virginiae]|uniref:S8 family peptidase n=1 Tax=Streptomyces virginiae TaxID=1961 RepID=UPI0038280BB3